ncbi:MAG: phage holin family protein [Rhodocyclaceae bacterium]|nr:phage holin family protein [Rhodocyclaceae bacterium]
MNTSMNTLLILNAVICAVICLRVVFYRRNGASFHPLSSAIAYLLAVASGAVTLQALLGTLPIPTLADTALHAVLCLALVASRGNVTEIFHTRQAENFIHKLITRNHHAQG